MGDRETLEGRQGAPLIRALLVALAVSPIGLAAPPAPTWTAASSPVALVGLGPFMASWDAYPDPTATFPLYVDGVRVAVAPAGATTIAFTLPNLGAHNLGLSATVAGVESLTRATLDVVATAPGDPCLAPLGAHAPAIFPTRVILTTGKPGSKSVLGFQLAAPDPITEVAIQIDGVDQAPIGAGTDLRSFGSLWFTQPAIGTHTLGIRVRTAFGCTLVRQTAPLVVAP